jgi:heme-degrading monooxygenase HmoA
VYARSTTIQASPAAIDKGIAHLRDKVMPTLMDMDGCVGLSLLVDRESGRCIATTSWETAEAMKATNKAVGPMRDEATKIFGATLESVQEYEIAVIHREHETREGTCVRVSWLKGDAGNADRGIEAFRSRVLPMAEELDGFCSASLMVDRKTGRLAGATAWDSRKAMEASRHDADKLRSDVANQFGGTIEAVREFELAIAHLRVPELV